MELETKFFVRYRIKGQELTLETEPYDTRSEAFWHCGDIAKFEGITLADVVERKCWIGKDVN